MSSPNSCRAVFLELFKRASYDECLLRGLTIVPLTDAGERGDLLRLLTTILLLVANAVASPGILTNQENSPKTASQPVKEATASYDKREYAFAAKLFQEAVAKGATDRVTLYSTIAPT